MILNDFDANRLLVNYYRLIAEISDEPGTIRYVAIFPQLLRYFPEFGSHVVIGSREEHRIFYCFIAELYESGEL